MSASRSLLSNSTAGDTGTAKVYRHALTVRLTHWLNALFLTVMLGSGLQIFNAHSALYWGSRSDPRNMWLDIGARRRPNGELSGFTRVGDFVLDTTGFLGVSPGLRQQPEVRAFPRWATIPGPRWLAMGRRWHFFFAWLLLLNGLVYVGYSIGSGHLRRELVPSGTEVRGIGRSVLQHLSLRGLRSESSRGYNVLQKITYLVVVYGLGPLLILTGLTMSPWLDSAFPWLLDLFGGRQSARSLHFLAAFGLVAFVAVHLIMVMLVGPLNHIRAMITGRLRIKTQAKS